jgi:N-acetylglucosamine-6-phosphate deacetylase
MGFKIATFQHVLEGYRVADEIAKHGAGGSTFSDWWAYKYEVIDAIPYNGTLMTERGVVTSFNSDDSELARRLNVEAAKAVRYGGLSETEALKLVTINPAIQLRVQDKIGSLEAGKDADFVIWNGNPLSTFTLAEQTWIDGRKYFDRAADLAQRKQLADERAALIAKTKEKDKKADQGTPSKTPAYLLWADNSDAACHDESRGGAAFIDARGAAAFGEDRQ